MHHVLVKAHSSQNRSMKSVIPSEKKVQNMVLQPVDQEEPAGWICQLSNRQYASMVLRISPLQRLIFWPVTIRFLSVSVMTSMVRSSTMYRLPWRFMVRLSLYTVTSMAGRKISPISESLKISLKTVRNMSVSLKNIQAQPFHLYLYLQKEAATSSSRICYKNNQYWQITYS